MVRVLIVGAGVTGSLCAQMLRRHFPTQLQCQIVVWEKSRGVGGRMSLSKAPEIENCSAELGAQYITQHPNYVDSHKGFFNDLIECGILAPFHGKIEGFHGELHPNFVSTNGLSAIAKHYFAKSSVEICPNVRLESLRQISDDNANGWNVWEASTTTGRHDHFDAVIMTIPTPQILDIEGVKGHLEESQVKDLESAAYSSRFAVGLFYENGLLNVEFPYVVKYVPDNGIIRYIAIDQAKRGVQSRSASIVVHTSAPFGKTHLEEDLKVVGPKIVEELKRIIPELPEPTFIKYHKWRYSQVTKATGCYGCMVPTKKPLLVFAGDAFTHSNFDGCIESALSVNAEIENWAKSLN